MAVKIGIISDTHGLLRQEVVENLKDCRYILHAGDVTDPGILDQLRVMGDLYAVQGNNDRSWQRPDLKDRQVVIFGHSHKYFQEIIDGRLWLNPGSCGHSRFGGDVTMAVMIVENGSYQVEKIVIPTVAI